MRYVCLAYVIEKEMAAMSESEAQAYTEECLAHREGLRRNGQLVLAHALAAVETATTIWVRQGKLTLTCSPFAETREQLGGFLLIDARDVNDAIRAASGIPLARRGSIEVRPVKEPPDCRRRLRGAEHALLLPR